MAHVRPFRGIRYDLERLGPDVALLVAPPYDVLDDAERDALYARHPYNVVRLDLNRPAPTDSRDDDRYTRARRYLMDWLAGGVLRLERDEALYVVAQEFDGRDGERVTRWGFIGRVELAAYEERVILPHERTLKGPKADRLALMKATETNLSQVFLLFDDPRHVVGAVLGPVMEHEPLVDITTEDGIRHKMWIVDDAKRVDAVTSFFVNETMLIADGHHRYETALAYRDFRRRVAQEDVEDAPYEYVTAFMVNMRDPGLVVYPTHRGVYGVEGFDAPTLVDELEAHADFQVTRLEDIDPHDGDALLRAGADAGAHRPSFVLCAGALDRAVLVEFSGGVRSSVFDPRTPEPVRAEQAMTMQSQIGVARWLEIRQNCSSPL
ncbi:MAG: DUF1015 domain-containing protein, partial [Myxococcota bacterium]